ERIHGLEARGMTSRDGRFGGGVHAMTSTAGLQIGAELDERVMRTFEDASHAGTSVAVSMRLSVPGVLPTDHHVDRFIDGGVEVGGGIAMLVGTASLTAGAERFLGAWLEIGNLDVSDGYVVFTVGARAIQMTGRLSDDTLYTFGIGWRGRRVVAPGEIRWR
ncbi:MAG TPA: hypothetical protein VGO00_04905, partial [Kofleriaceae bacterium]|nr:hypothetical protein [Kofleriaceae bacterium]